MLSSAALDLVSPSETGERLEVTLSEIVPPAVPVTEASRDVRVGVFTGAKKHNKVDALKG